jgi:hypothetical protein
MRRAEKKWRRTKLTVHHLSFLASKKRFQEEVSSSKKQHLDDMITKHADDPKRIWEVLNRALGRAHQAQLPMHHSAPVLATEFNFYFIDKVDHVRSNLPNTDLLALENSTSVHGGPFLSQFSLASEREVYNVIRSSPTKSDIMDPIPTWLLKKHLDILLPVLTALINRALSTGMPVAFKHALIRPLLKKRGTDVNDKGNYRPVSGLPFLSKVIERLVSARIVSHVETINGFDPFQSAYRRNHSCETVLTAMLNDVFTAADMRHIAVLTLLDLSAAFDTVDWEILLTRLSAVGIRGAALHWIENFILNRSQSVLIGDSTSSSQLLSCGVPQGSVLGPLLFILYLHGLSDIFERHGVRYYIYADDIQFIFICTPLTLDAALRRISACVQEVRARLASLKLSLNGKKTEIIILGGKQMVKKTTTDHIVISDTRIEVSNVVRDLGVWLDSMLSFDTHISRIVSSAFSYLHVIGRVKKSLSVPQCMLLIHSLVFSRLNFCPTILNGVTISQFSRLQRVINAAVRVGHSMRKYDSVKEILVRLELLPVQQHVCLRTACLLFSIIHTGRPTYLSSLLQWHIPSRELRSGDLDILKVPFVRSKLGERAFAWFAPTVWNSIPKEIRKSPTLAIFKAKLHSHLMGKVD